MQKRTGVIVACKKAAKGQQCIKLKIIQRKSTKTVSPAPDIMVAANRDENCPVGDECVFIYPKDLPETFFHYTPTPKYSV